MTNTTEELAGTLSTPLARSLTRIEALRAELAAVAEWAEAHPDHELHLSGSLLVFTHAEDPDAALTALLDGAEYGTVVEHERDVRRGFGSMVCLVAIPNHPEPKPQPRVLNPAPETEAVA